MITSKQLRKKYLDFFVNEEHRIIPSASLIPENDPTALFTMAGMHPLVPYLMGERHPAGKRLVNIQKCIRTGDIDEVGDTNHLTFMEMLGNWSLGDYFKKEIIKWSWEFFTDSKYLGFDKDKLAVTVFAGDERYPDLPADDEAVKLWQEVGVSDQRIARMPGGVVEREDNWWGPAGLTGPCGPSTEIFYWVGDSLPPAGSNPGNDNKNWLEVGNNVLMQYSKTIENKFEQLSQKNVDTGMGLERMLAVVNNLTDVYQIDTLWPLIQKIEEISGKEYVENYERTKAMRIIADHIRATVMIMGDRNGISPSNIDQGYIVRRLIRRAIRQGHTLEINENFCSSIAEKVIEIFADVYQEIEDNKDFILTEIAKEESKFRHTLERGIKVLRTELQAFDSGSSRQAVNITDGFVPYSVTGKFLFDMYQSYGFPFELAIEEIKNNRGFINKDIDEDLLKKEFNKEMKKHQELSRQGGEQRFKGGLADDSEMSKKYHTATHLLHTGLRKVLGEHVEQRGSNINEKRLRFDFSHPEKLTDEQKQQVEDFVNKVIEEDYQVLYEEMTVEEAKKQGAIGLFIDKYGNKVKVYSVGDVSKEICGGPHAERTGILGKFRIKKEKASSAGIRRIKAVLE